MYQPNNEWRNHISKGQYINDSRIDERVGKHVTVHASEKSTADVGVISVVYTYPDGYTEFEVRGTHHQVCSSEYVTIE